LTWKGIPEDVVTRHTICVARNEDVWNPRETQGLSRDQAQKLCLPYVIDSQSGDLPAPCEIGNRVPGRRATGKRPGSISILVPDPKLSPEDIGRNRKALVDWDFQKVKA